MFIQVTDTDALKMMQTSRNMQQYLRYTNYLLIYTVVHWLVYIINRLIILYKETESVYCEVGTGL